MLEENKSKDESPKFIKPMYDRVVLIAVERKESKGGLVKSSNVFRTQRAEVIAVGPGKYNMDTGKYTKMHVKPGDIVYANLELGNLIKFPGNPQKYILMKEDEIIGAECELPEGE